jgi:hypothetical protein
LFAHDLFRKPGPTQDQVRGRLFSGSCFMAEDQTKYVLK